MRGKKLSDNEVHKMLKLADLEISLSDRPGSELSVGQAQRVALARTLANEPEVLKYQQLITQFYLSYYSLFTL